MCARRGARAGFTAQLRCSFATSDGDMQYLNETPAFHADAEIKYLLRHRSPATSETSLVAFAAKQQLYRSISRAPQVVIYDRKCTYYLSTNMLYRALLAWKQARYLNYQDQQGRLMCS